MLALVFSSNVRTVPSKEKPNDREADKTYASVAGIRYRRELDGSMAIEGFTYDCPADVARECSKAYSVCELEFFQQQFGKTLGRPVVVSARVIGLLGKEFELVAGGLLVAKAAKQSA